MILDRTASLERLSGDTPTEAWADVDFRTEYRINIQPATAEAVIMSEGEFSKTFVGFVEANMPARTGDRIRVGAYSYTVRGIEDFRFGIIPHKRLTLLEE